MRSASLMAPLLAAFAIGACGGDAAGAEETVSSAVSAFAAGDSDEVCSKLTPAARSKVVVNLRSNPIGRPIKAKTCEQGLTKLHASLSKAIKDNLVDGKVEDAKLDGDKATVQVVGAGMKVELQKRDERWLITGGFFN